jgi:hypothetical protein
MTGTPSTTGRRTPGRDPGHRRKGTAPATDADLLARYRRTLRLELLTTLDELRPEPTPGLFGPNVDRPTLATRRQLVDMAVALVRALASPLELEGEPESAGPAPAPRRHRARTDFG